VRRTVNRPISRRRRSTSAGTSTASPPRRRSRRRSTSRGLLLEVVRAEEPDELQQVGRAAVDGVAVKSQTWSALLSPTWRVRRAAGFNKLWDSSTARIWAWLTASSSVLCP
jgi:hypothetical protein